MRTRPLALTLAIVLGLGLVWVGSGHATGLAERPAAVAPGFVLPDLAGRDVAVKDSIGKVVLVHFWATWCSPCIVELPSLQALWDDWRDQGLEVLTVAADSRDEVQRFVDRVGLRLPVVIDAYGEAMRAYRVRGLPTTIILDRKGSIRLEAMGQVEWEDPAVRTQLQRLLLE